MLEAFSPAMELAAFEQRLDQGAGGVVTFTGLARGLGIGGAAIQSLFLQHHPRLTQRSLEDTTAAAVQRFGLTAAEVVHRAGEIAPGEAIVWVAAAAPHRRAAFEAVDYLMDRLKTEAVFWKREDGTGGPTWIEPTETDHQSRSRWE